MAEALRQTRLLTRCGAALACAAAFGTVCGGCSSSSPRFRSDSSPPAVVQGDDEFRFAARIREEETREDDRKVDLERTRNELVGRGRRVTEEKNITPAGLDRDRMLLDVVSYLGVPYDYGGTTKKGIDCSGFTSCVYASAVNTSLPRSAKEQFAFGSEVTKENLEFGDLVFFNTTGHSPSHVGIYIEDSIFAHASVSYGVTLSSLESSYYKKRFVGARRVVH